MPDNVYFRQPATQNMMLDILFVWCKMHPDIGYRQGMHEILAPLLWVVERDAIELTGSSPATADDTLADMLDASYIEHDTHTLFALIMQTAKSYYAPADSGSTTKETPMLARSSKIFERYLPQTDPELHAHLVKLEIVPQIFLLRWIRLLFGREFGLDDVFDMWDALFAIDSTLDLVDMISVSMLLRIRWELLAADTNEAFALLLRYPEPATPAYTFIKDALYLRDHLNTQGGSEIITRYGKPPPAIRLDPAPRFREPSPSPLFSSHRPRNSLGSPRSFVGQQGAGIEALFQGAAKNVLERGSQWGVGKALRDAVGEVRKNVEAYQSATNSGQSTPRSGGREFRKPAQFGAVSTRASLDQTYSANAAVKIEELDRRNRGLAKMLEVAVGDLWEYHREQNEDQKMIEGDDKGKKSMEALSLAIAKVQFVQVYLEDSSIPLPVEEVTEQTATAKAVATLSSPKPQSPVPPENGPEIRPITVTSTAEVVPKVPISTEPSISTTSQAMLPPKQAQMPSTANLSPRSRPHLTSSNFSWMLAEDSASSDFATGTAHSTFSADEKRRMKGKGFLFGEDDDDDGSIKDGKRGSVSSKSGAKGGKTTKSKHASEHAEVEEEVIDLNNMGARGVI